MDRKLGHVMTNSRMITFIAFLAAIFAWFLHMNALFFVSVVALIGAACLFIKDKYFPVKVIHPSNREKNA
ncbi:hypothetical protein RJD38_20805 [Vibrio scophthalmi]|uniref:Uncharacterized protein n=2 Tax=Vibrio scophthalmi TaxID=45658 RepID=A0A1B1NW17_9VIBR|nr:MULTISPECIES: hypothetical protein [Vibrio]ANS87841.1 hypothetical protein VSVS12_04141 [Vibrio scophthalmi]ANU38644.1 hypothetical protein VSVS05_03607 [Vibrio scophthalmi]EGU32461.1 hypothetical protein VIS19158_06580 [Vibrio scophthalmi LMG 19158]EGU32874.1 hypothetical protein VIBRN418_10343 [Vibrio sp. N418]MCY9804612.1 hypothetical protein [Vibrio scophthalmi]